LWDGEGNLGNVFFGKENNGHELAVCGIDQCITSIITHDENLQKYLDRVENFLNELENFEKSGSQSLERLRANLNQRVRYDMGAAGLKQVWIGVIRGIVDLLDWLGLEAVEGAAVGDDVQSTSSKIREWYEDCESLLDDLQQLKEGAFDTQGRYGFIRVDIDFLEEILNRFNRRPKLRELLRELTNGKEIVEEF
jgi:hypothetical protein